MFDSVFGLPLHPLVVHGAVVLLPLMAVVTAVVGWLRLAWTWVAGVAVADAGVAALAFVAAESGEALERRVPANPRIEAHAELGEMLPRLSALLFLGALALAWVAWRRHTASRPAADGIASDPVAADRTATPSDRVLSRSLAILVSLIAVVLLVWVVRVGHSGATAVWFGVVS